MFVEQVLGRETDKKCDFHLGNQHVYDDGEWSISFAKRRLFIMINGWKFTCGPLPSATREESK